MNEEDDFADQLAEEFAPAELNRGRNGDQPNGGGGADADDDGKRELWEFRILQPCTDMGNAVRFRLDNVDVARFVPGLGWHCWDARRWRPDDDGEAERLAKATARRIKVDAAHIIDPDESGAMFKWGLQSQNAPKLRAMLDLAITERQLVARADGLDADPFLLCVENGTLDLRTGQLRPHDPADHITKIAGTNYDPAAVAPTWLEHLRVIFDGDDDLAAYLQRWVGYCLTGDVTEQCLMLSQGDGENGKTTTWETISRVLGDYARGADAHTFTTAASDRAARSDIARLQGARLVTTDEITAGAHLAEGLVKQLTGGDRIVARFLYHGEFEFVPVLKLCLSVNHLPAISGGDHAIWRRIRVIPFEQRITKPDKRFAGKLRDELPGVLAWAIEGCVAWQRDGLGSCAAVERATGAYRRDQERVTGFLADCCERDMLERVKRSELLTTYAGWERAHGRSPLDAKVLYAELRNHGFAEVKSHGERYITGLRLIGDGDV